MNHPYIELAQKSNYDKTAEINDTLTKVEAKLCIEMLKKIHVSKI